MAPRARHRLIRFLILVGLVVGGFLVLLATPLSRYLTGTDLEVVLQELTELLETLRQEPAAPVLLVLGGAVLPSFGMPASLILVSGGAVFGTLYGGLLSLVGLYASAFACYLLARTLARDLVVHLLGRRLAPVVERLLERHGFWTMVRLRMIPVPFPLINYGAGLVGVRPRTFALSTVIGLTPAAFVFSYFSSSLVAAAEGELAETLRNLGAASLLLVSLSFLPAIFKAWRRRVHGDPAQEPTPPPADRP